MNDMVIIDASVLLTAIIGNNKNAEEQLKTILHNKTRSPSVLPFTATEFTNGVRFSTRDKALAKQALNRFITIGLPILLIAPSDLHAIIDLSYRLGTTVYDTAYHYMAIMHDGTFITCDRNYQKKASTLGHIELWG